MLCHAPADTAEETVGAVVGVEAARAGPVYRGSVGTAVARVEAAGAMPVFCLVKPLICIVN